MDFGALGFAEVIFAVGQGAAAECLPNPADRRTLYDALPSGLRGRWPIGGWNQTSPSTPTTDSANKAAGGSTRIHQTELRDESFRIAEQLQGLAQKKGVSLSQLTVAWVLANLIVTSAIIGPRTIEQYENYLGALTCKLEREDEEWIDRLVPPGEHTGWGFNDPNYPVRGRPRRV
jgi:hypothetical protein